MMVGLPGSGKSFLARRLQPRLQACIIETDQVRHALFHPPTYSSAESAWVYRVCHELIGRMLRQRRSVIFDATNLRERSRRDLYRIAASAQARAVVVHAVASDSVIRQRLIARQRNPEPGDNSDATVGIYDKLRQTEQPIRRPHLVIDTTEDLASIIERIVQACRAAEQEPMPHEQDDGYVVVEHTADVALRVWGRSLEDLFCNAARGMFAQMADLTQTAPTVRREITLEADDEEALLVAWLNELLYLREVNREVYVRFNVRFPRPGAVHGTAEGAHCAKIARPIKAATYHDLRIARTDSGYEATIVFDV